MATGDVFEQAQMVAQRDSSSQPATRAQFDWPLIDEKLFSMIFLLREALNSDTILKATDICFEFQPPKCVSLYFNGHHMDSSTVFSMAAGNTINICNVDCTKFLGCTIGVSPTIARSVASANMKQQILQFLHSIDKSSVRGEYKI